MRLDEGAAEPRVDPPDRLFRFVADEWPDGLDAHHRRSMWAQARAKWAEEHGWPGGLLWWLRGELAARGQVGALSYGPPPRSFVEAEELAEAEQRAWENR